MKTKKLLSFILAVMFLFGLIPAAAIQTGANVNSLPDNMITLPVAPYANIVIDGQRDFGYGDPFKVDSFFKGIPGATAKVWAAWDETGIFYYLEVYDVTPNHEHSNSWERDCVEFFIDWNSNFGSDIDNHGNPYWNLLIASATQPGISQAVGLFPGSGWIENGEHFVVRPLEGYDLEKGYILEVWLPWEYAQYANGAKPLKEGIIIIVDFQIHDNQNGKGRTSQTFLIGDDDMADMQFQVPCACRGILTLGPAKIPPFTKIIKVTFGETRYILNGEPFDQPAMVYDGTAYLPAAYLATKLGLNTFWDKDTNTTTLTSTGKLPDTGPGGVMPEAKPETKEITATFGATKYILNGVLFDQPTIVYNGTAYLPAAYLATKLGLSAVWDKATNITTLTSK